MSKPDSDSGRHSAELDEIVEEYLELAEQDDAPSIEEYARKYPQYGSELIRVLETMRVVQHLQPKSSQEKQPATQRVESEPVIADYRILRVAGRGGMGVVYEAIQLSLDRKVALKVLPQVLFQNERARQRFQLEARAAAGLHHSNIVPVHDVGIENEHCYYAMQFIEGDTLDHVISQLRLLRDRPENVSQFGLPTNVDQVATQQNAAEGKSFEVSESDAARCLTIALSLDATTLPSGTPARLPTDHLELDATIDSDALHTGSAKKTQMRGPGGSESLAKPSSGSRRSDSAFGSSSGNKPFFLSVARIGKRTAEALNYAHENGVVHRDIKPANLMLDSHGQIWITDFGLAKLGDTNDLTRDGDVVGTLRYMAPERFEGKCDERSDIFSLGVTLYELLALQSPFDATDRMQLIQQIRHAKPPSLRSLNRRVPYDLQTIVEKSMESQPNRRYATAQELAEDLGRFYDGRPILARRVSSIEKLWLWSKKNAGLAAAFATVLLLLVVGTIGSSIAAVQFRASREEARAQSQLAYDTLNQVLFDIQESLEEIPAASGARRRLLQTALEGLEKTSEQFIASADTDRRLAAALQQLSSLAITTGVSGETDQSAFEFAESAAIRAVDISEKLLTEQPNRSLAIRDMSISLSSLGAVRQAQGRLAAARKAFQKASELSERNLKLNTDPVQALKDAADARVDLGLLESTALQHSLALENFEAAYALLLELLKIVPPDNDALRSEAFALKYIGDTCLRIEGKGALSLEKLEAAWARFQQLYDQQPDSVRTQRDLMLACESIAYAYGRVGDSQARFDAETRGYTIAKQMLVADPQNLDLKIRVIETMNTMAATQSTLKKLESSKLLYAEAWELSEELYADYPQSQVIQKMLCMKLTMLGQTTRDLGNYDEAIVAFRRAGEVARQHSSDPDRGDFYRRWAQTMDDLIEDSLDRKQSGQPPEYWLEPPPGWTDRGGQDLGLEIDD